MNAIKKIFVFLIVISCIAIVGYKIYEQIEKKNAEPDFLVTINDTLPDGQSKKARVILLGGQSNAAGCSRDEYLKKNVSDEQYEELKNGYDNVYINYYVSGNNKSNGFVKSGLIQGEAGGFFGPELGMAQKLNELYPDEQFFIIKCAWGGTNLYEQWLSPSSRGKTGYLYNNFVKFVNESMEYLISKNYDAKIEGMCWMQGESDAFLTSHAIKYEKLLINFIKDIRKEFSQYSADDGIAFIDAYISENWPYHELLNESKKSVADSFVLNTVIDTQAHGLTCSNEPEESPDLAHYDSLSELKLGNLFINSLTPFIN